MVVACCLLLVACCLFWWMVDLSVDYGSRYGSRYGECARGRDPGLSKQGKGNNRILSNTSGPQTTTDDRPQTTDHRPHTAKIKWGRGEGSGGQLGKGGQGGTAAFELLHFLPPRAADD
jgi:hypothetical protein